MRKKVFSKKYIYICIFHPSIAICAATFCNLRRVRPEHCALSLWMRASCPTASWCLTETWHSASTQPAKCTTRAGRGEGTLRLMAIDGLHSNSQLNLHNEWQRLLTLLSLSMIAISSLLVSSDGTSDTLSVTFIVKATVVCKHQHLACTNLDIDVQC